MENNNVTNPTLEIPTLEAPSAFFSALDAGATLSVAAGFAEIDDDTLKTIMQCKNNQKKIKKHAARSRIFFMQHLRNAVTIAAERGDVRSIVQAMQTLFPVDYPNVKQVEVKEIKDNYMGMDLSIDTEKKDISIEKMTTSELLILAERLK